MFNYDGKGDLLTETWKDIKGWEGQYKVSNVGKVQSLKKSGRLRKPSLTDDGYLVLDLYGKNKREKVLVHRLVATAFLSEGKDLTGLEVNHIDGNKLNNSVENLEWVTHSENILHAYKNKLIPNGRTRGTPVAGYTSDLQLLGQFDTIAEASQKTGASKAGIWRSCHSSYLKAGGYKWEYVTAKTF